MDDVVEQVRARVRGDTPFWAGRFGRIVDKSRKLVPFAYNEGQLELDRCLEGQAAAGRPMRAVVLKARQVGFSTSIQSKLIHRTTLREFRSAITVANDRELGAKLYRMGEVLYENLPDDPELNIKPPIGQYARGQKLHFGDLSRGSWESGAAWPNSSYMVDTAQEGNAGRGGTYTDVHASEAAFWPGLGEKLTALLNGVPDDPDTLVVIESTANGHNEFKDFWDKAERGESDFIAFFWPWFKQEEYSLKFANDAERAAFVVGDGQYGEEEELLVAEHGCSLEQLHWRRWAIANKCGGDLRIFHQEFPSNPEQAFLSTGQKVFDPYRVQALLRHVDVTDPKVPVPETPGPTFGEFKAQGTKVEQGRNGPVEVPDRVLWVPWQEGPRKQPWRLWTDLKAIEGRAFVMSVDPSGGELDSVGEPDYHAIQVIDHKTRQQVAEFHNRSMDPDEVAYQAMLAAMFFNMPWVAIERTGGWGLPIIRRLLYDFHYPYLYRSKRFGTSNEKMENKLGWDTTQRTKPIIVAGSQELMREDDFGGIQSRLLAREIDTYVKDEKGKMDAAPGKHDDLLMAWMIAQQVAADMPVLGELSGFNRPGAGSGGLSSYDPRF